MRDLHEIVRDNRRAAARELSAAGRLDEAVELVASDETPDEKRERQQRWARRKGGAAKLRFFRDPKRSL